MTLWVGKIRTMCWVQWRQATCRRSSISKEWKAKSIPYTVSLLKVPGSTLPFSARVLPGLATCHHLSLSTPWYLLAKNTCLFVCLFVYYLVRQGVGCAQGSAHARQCSTAEHTTESQQQHLGACHKTTLSPSNFNNIASFTLTPMSFYFLGRFQTDTKVDHMGEKSKVW